MGCSPSHEQAEYDAFVLHELEKCCVIFEQLGFASATSKAARALFKCFEKLDKDSGGSVSFAEFAEFFRLDKNPFTERCFLLLDRGATGEINFAQFIVCTWNYCSHDRGSLTRFAYSLYDLEGNGNIPIDHLYSLVEDMYDIHGKGFSGDGTGMNLIKNTPEYNCNRVKLLIKNAAGEDAMMQLEEFIQFVRKTPTLLTVAFTIQSKLQAEVCGVKFWSGLNSYRRETSTIGVRPVNMFEIDDVILAFEEQWPQVFKTKKKKKSELSTSRRHGRDDLASDGGGKNKKRNSRMGKGGKSGGKYGLSMALPEGDFNVKTSMYEERESEEEEKEKMRPPRPSGYKKGDRRRERRRSSVQLRPNEKMYPKNGKLRKLKRHNSAKKLQAAYRGTVARRTLPAGESTKAQERRKRLAMKSRAESSTEKGKKRKKKLARKKSLQSPKGRGAASFY